MNTRRKKNFLRVAQKHVVHANKRISERIRQLWKVIERIDEKMKTPYIYSNESADKSEKPLDEKKRQEAFISIDNYTLLKKSPYFSKCEARFDNESEKRIFYFGKFSLPQTGIYSWISPVAKIRFRNIGKTSYTLPNLKERKLTLLRKDNFMISDGKIKFMSVETERIKKTLIYQAQVTDQKRSFMLKEIIEQMEEYQDSIIRTNPFGSMLISGPAGSGKTTLALHRVAYLLQSPETSDIFRLDDVLILLQDDATRDYFNNLLPELGIRNVLISTFEEWMASILSLRNVSIVPRFGNTSDERISLEFEKIQVLKNIKGAEKVVSPFYILQRYYKNSLSPYSYNIFKLQKRKRQFDRIDLLILIKLFARKRKLSFRIRVSRKDKKALDLPQYSLIVIDEAENYLAEEIAILKNSISPKTSSILYVGDLKQQSRMWAYRNWNEIGERFSDKKHIKLSKVYRNSREILYYIKSLGYDISLPKNILQEGKVLERVMSRKEEISFIEHYIKQFQNKTIGIVARDKEYSRTFHNLSDSFPNVKVFSFKETQGVEFDTLFIVGINKQKFSFYTTKVPQKLREERQRAEIDLLYVALTRAISELYIFGKDTLSDIFSSL